MKNYNFSNLNDKEFELLALDLYSLENQVKTERFKSGKDKGVDGRFFSDGKEVILQCKHWLKSDYKALITHLKKTELGKVQALNPSRYVFITSQPLSRVNKKEIFKLFHPFIKDEDDIWGNEKLNDVIARFPKVEREHYKLWISSTNVLQRLLNEGFYGRSNEKLNTILERSHLYVQTDSHRQAWKILEENHTLIISGAPGIGKTTLADYLCLDYIREGYSLFHLEDDLKNAEAVFNQEEKQIFLFDDFLGRNYLKAIQNHTDSLICSFINRVKRDPNKRFILTTRTNILNLGVSLSDIFVDKKIRHHEFELKIESLSSIDKARILYNHLWFGNLDLAFINEIYTSKRYRLIINDANFNPRLVSFFTDMDRLSHLKSSEYWNYIGSIFRNPEEIWSNVFKVQLNECGRILTCLVAFNGKAIEEGKLRDSYQDFMNLYHGKLHDNLSDFKDVSRVLTGALINRTMVLNSRVTYDLFNPSIADFIYKKYSGHDEALFRYFLCLNSISSLKVLKDLAKNNVINQNSYLVILKRLLKSQMERERTTDHEYLFYIGYQLMDNKVMTTDLINELISYTDVTDLDLQQVTEDYEVIQFFRFLLAHSDATKLLDSARGYIKDAVSSIDDGNFDELIDLCDDIDPALSTEVHDELRTAAIELMKDQVTDMVIEHEIFRLEDLGSTLSTRRVADFLEDNSPYRNLNFSRDEFVDIADTCDFDKVTETISRNYEDDERFQDVGVRNSSIMDTIDEIDDLFSRDD